MLTAHEVVLDGHSWKLCSLPAAEGLRVLRRLLVVLGRPFAQIISAGDREATYAIGDAVQALVIELADDDIGILQRLLKGLEVDGRPAQFDLDFAGAYGTLAQVVVWAVKANFQSFFDVLQASAAGMLATTLATTKSQKHPAQAKPATP